MKAKMVIFGDLCLLLCCMHFDDSQKIIVSVNTQKDYLFPLDMARNSVDDMYSNCAKIMKKKVKDMFFKKEMEDKLFKPAWEAAEECANQNLKKREEGDKALTKDLMQAMCTYTNENPNLYKKFNEEVRTKREAYGSSFRFHSLYFWLTRAIQILNKQKKCKTTFRRTTEKFTGNVKQTIRFGAFTSTSFESNLTSFGRETCFKIKTCHGAYLKTYSVFQHEREVLIPPYEKFKIISNNKKRELQDCEVVYVLKSAGVQSNLDCQIANS
ncbi:LOW QUALITY PROTEIN: erythroblast NAD(P)(+)--arginine ADP-ribosyltransferase-like [Cyprinodon tularosa]|uniref:LOW QUALITY PROTEIN: erythroblast NAD(P)(+)--arginine ADP-ribosyltransferase-like n=1 Tax=Cyprinodon tularosa TaxID=77115 RepID=UPI0018E20F59|nr:LOW QUALITY PROTEIN: erythroblast NAD(P)(+)--arginine ADP-ribosyltransferase-like [Cyprinodon tularosa]